CGLRIVSSSAALCIQLLSPYDHFSAIRKPYCCLYPFCLYADRGKMYLRMNLDLLWTDSLCQTLRLAFISDNFDIISFVRCGIDLYHCPFLTLLKLANRLEKKYRIIAFRLSHIFPLREIQGHQAWCIGILHAIGQTIKLPDCQNIYSASIWPCNWDNYFILLAKDRLTG